MNKAILVTLLFVLSLAQPISANAQYYGNGSSNPEIIVDKKIKLPHSERLLDNLSKDDFLFKEGDQIEFAISVENRGSTTLYDVNVVDKLPDYLKVQYSFGKLDSNKTKIESTIPVLKAGEVKKYAVIALVSGLPNSNYTKSLKLVNSACAGNSQTNDCDNSSFYAGVKTMPVTGTSENLVISTFLLTSLVGGVLTLRKLVRGY